MGKKKKAPSVAKFLAKQQAEDQAKLAEITARYQLKPAANMDDLLAQMDPTDAEAVREIRRHEALYPAPFISRAEADELREALFGDLRGFPLA